MDSAEIPMFTVYSIFTYKIAVQKAATRCHMHRLNKVPLTKSTLWFDLVSRQLSAWVGTTMLSTSMLLCYNLTHTFRESDRHTLIQWIWRGVPLWAVGGWQWKLLRQCLWSLFVLFLDWVDKIPRGLLQAVSPFIGALLHWGQHCVPITPYAVVTM